MNKVVIAVSRAHDPSRRIQELVEQERAEVVAVAVDLTEPGLLEPVRQQALAAGAARCHAMDLSEEFARECVIPALAARVPIGEASAFLQALAEPFVSAKLREIAAIEGGTATCAPVAAALTPRRTRPVPETPASLVITFDDRVPVAVNGIPMTLTEMMDSIELIAGMPAVSVLDVAYAELDRAPAGPVALRCHRGEVAIMPMAAAS